MLWSSSQMWILSWLHPTPMRPNMQLASSPSTVGFITRDFHALISRQHSQTNLRSLHTLFLTSESRCMQKKISSVDALLTIQNVLSWSGRFGGGHTGWSQLQLASSVSPLWTLLSVRLSVRPSVRPSVTSFWQCSCHCIILKFSGVITIDRSDVHAKGQGQRSRSQRPRPNLTVPGL